jgi:hypothetical protein
MRNEVLSTVTTIAVFWYMTPAYILKMDTARSSETSAIIYQTIWRHIRENSDRNISVRYEFLAVIYTTKLNS